MDRCSHMYFVTLEISQDIEKSLIFVHVSFERIDYLVFPTKVLNWRLGVVANE